MYTVCGPAAAGGAGATVTSTATSVFGALTVTLPFVTCAEGLGRTIRVEAIIVAVAKRRRAGSVVFTALHFSKRSATTPIRLSY
jgi:hypothetical protein